MTKKIDPELKILRLIARLLPKHLDEVGGSIDCGRLACRCCRLGRLLNELEELMKA